MAPRWVVTTDACLVALKVSTTAGCWDEHSVASLANLWAAWMAALMAASMESPWVVYLDSHWADYWAVQMVE